MSALRDETAGREAAFEFARQLRHSHFRDSLRRMGWQSGQDIVVALDTETVGDVIDRVLFQTRPPAFIAIRRPEATLGFVFIVLVPAGLDAPMASDKQYDKTELGPTTSIGMFYDALVALRSLLINEWLRAQPVTS